MTQAMTDLQAQTTASPLPLKSVWVKSTKQFTTKANGEMFSFDVLALETVEFNVHACAEEDKGRFRLYAVDAKLTIETNGRVVSSELIMDSNERSFPYECVELSYPFTATVDTKITANLVKTGSTDAKIEAGRATFSYKIWGDGYTPITSG